MSEITVNFYEKLSEEEKLVLFSMGALSNSPIRSKVKMQKLLFLFSNVFEGFKEKFEFEPHLLGPYSDNTEYILEDLEKLELIHHKGTEFTLSEKGNSIFNQMKPTEDVIKVIEDFKEFLNDLTDDEILTFVYVSYPEYVDESARWDKLKKDRIKVAISLLKKEKISFSKAAEIADLNYSDFEDLLKKRGIKWRG